MELHPSGWGVNKDSSLLLSFHRFFPPNAAPPTTCICVDRHGSNAAAWLTQWHTTVWRQIQFEYII